VDAAVRLIDETIPAGLCQCGCGAITEPAKRTNTKRGTVSGQPMLYVGRHKSRGWPKSAVHRRRISAAQAPERFTDDNYRSCKDCGQKKLLDDFPPTTGRGLQGRLWSCRVCYRGKCRGWGNATYAKRRHELVALLGSRCSRCGLDDERVLAIDHVNGGGSRDKRMKTGAQYKRDLAREIEAGSTDYRLLCHNCNWLAYLERGK